MMRLEGWIYGHPTRRHTRFTGQCSENSCSCSPGACAYVGNYHIEIMPMGTRVELSKRADVALDIGRSVGGRSRTTSRR